MPLTANSSVESFEPEDAAASRCKSPSGTFHGDMRCHSNMCDIAISASHLGQTNTRPSVEPCSGLSRVNILNHARAKSASFEKVNFVSELFPSPCRSPSNLGAPTQQRPQDRSSASMMLENALNPNTLEDFNYVFPVRTRFRSQSQQFSCDSRDQISRTKQRVSSLSLISQEGFRGSCNSRPVQGYEDMAFRRQSIGRTVETDDVDLYPTAAVGSRKMIQCVDIHNLPPPTQREQYGLQASRGWHNSQLCAGRRNSSYSTTPSLLPPASSNSVEGYGQDDHSSYVQDLPRHEDRLDAFDYQNFILHSALGHYFSDRPPSRSSVGSNTTARPFENIAAGGPLHSRSNSMDSISTFATFATATEGFESPPDEDRAADDNISRLYKSVKKTKTEPSKYFDLYPQVGSPALLLIKPI